MQSLQSFYLFVVFLCLLSLVLSLNLLDILCMMFLYICFISLCTHIVWYCILWSTFCERHLQRRYRNVFLNSETYRVPGVCSTLNQTFNLHFNDWKSFYLMFVCQNINEYSAKTWNRNFTFSRLIALSWRGRVQVWTPANNQKLNFATESNFYSAKLLCQRNAN